MKGPHKVGDCIASRYIINDFVGEGGMQFVYKAWDNILNRFIALKTPKNASAEKRFLRSAVVSAKVNHPNVAKTLDYVEEGDIPYLIEELVEGQDLSEAILKKIDFLDPFLVARLFHYLAKGLAASHHANVIHRDLKPTNIMINGTFQLTEVKITDFGIAKMAGDEMTEAAEGGSDTISASATAVGALPYMAPEAIETPREVTLKADIWSLGAMMYEMLVGKKPFGSGLRAVRHIVTGNYDAFPDFLTSNPQFRYLSSELISLIKSCLIVDASKRPSADDLVESCSQLCYPVSKRFLGVIENLQYNAFGYISVPEENNVFYHVSCIYGDKPKVGEQVMISKYDGGGSDRALPVVRIKQM
ncbi:MAG: serine/threonine protein kinase [Cocleimonas sp.]|jgi:serine/threonine protein kinase